MELKKLALMGAIVLLTGCTSAMPEATTLANWATNIAHEPSTDPNIPNADLGQGYTCTSTPSSYVIADWCIDKSTITSYAPISGAKQVDLKLDFINQGNTSNMGYITAMQTNVFNCKAGTMGVLNYTYYTASGSIFQQSPADAQLDFATPDPSTLGYQIMQEVCK